MLNIRYGLRKTQKMKMSQVIYVQLIFYSSCYFFVDFEYIHVRAPKLASHVDVQSVQSIVSRQKGI